MPKINLLPWREGRRKQQQQDFLVAMTIAILGTCIIFIAIYIQLENTKKYQQMRNLLLKDEIKLVNQKIAEIKKIELKKSQLMIKIKLLQQLQESRPQIVHLFTEMAKTTPAGIYLTEFKQQDKNLFFSGLAQSNGIISTYMRNIEISAWLSHPVLKEIKAKENINNKQLSSFSMSAKQSEIKPNKTEAKK